MDTPVKPPDSAPSAGSELLMPPAIQYVAAGAPGHHLRIVLYPDGRLIFDGSRGDVERFLAACAAIGLDIDLETLSFCG